MIYSENYGVLADGLVFDLVKNARDVEAAVCLIRTAYSLGHTTYHLMQTMAAQLNLDAPFLRSTYPAEWIGKYVMKGYIHTDPIINEGYQRMLPFDWSEIELSEQAMTMLMDFRSHGFGTCGYSIPIVDKSGRRALLSLNSKSGSEAELEWPSLVKRFRHDWAELGEILHNKAIIECFGVVDPTPILSPRELETLEWIAKGKDHKAIAVIIELSEHTVRAYMRSARLKLGCVNMAQTVAKAMQLKLIKP